MRAYDEVRVRQARQYSAQLNKKVEQLERRLSSAVDKELLLLEQVIRYKERIDELENTGPVVHLNPGSLLPPVDCPLLIETPVGLIQATRTTFLSSKAGQMTYRLVDGSEVEGRFRWTYP